MWHAFRRMASRKRLTFAPSLTMMHRSERRVRQVAAVDDVDGALGPERESVHQKCDSRVVVVDDKMLDFKCVGELVDR